ncbi:LysR family transcriptional regulator [Chryseolinea sp. T2]|uniref:helix-turn-helix domain-containing protein n=1 Tax=Chryseolinea sp. T2 TaxID=3129255 RepID=UPI003077B0EB
MLVDFASLKPHSRVWIYHSKRKFTPDEKEIIYESLSSFTNDWSAHGVPLVSSFDIKLDSFIILAVDEEAHGASGCSIDGSTRAMKALEERLGLPLFDRAQASFVRGNELFTFPVSKLREAASTGEWNSETLCVNTLVATKGELESGFVIPAGATWLKRYLPAAPITG